jgi:glycosyltransferase involved in cell wall biosynthesis
VIVTSPLTARTLVADLGVPADRIAVALPGVDPAPVAEVGDVLRRLLCVGTLTPRKGHLVLLEALATSRDLDWRLVCAGSVDRDPGTADAVRGLSTGWASPTASASPANSTARAWPPPTPTPACWSRPRSTRATAWR